MIRKPSKYRAKPTVVDNIRFDSKKEAQRYQELKLLEKAGRICDLELQPVYPLLVPAIGPRCVRIGIYKADFGYREFGELVRTIEDVKGFRTPLYKWKKRHVEAQYGIQIREL